MRLNAGGCEMNAKRQGAGMKSGIFIGSNFRSLEARESRNLTISIVHVGDPRELVMMRTGEVCAETVADED